MSVGQGVGQNKITKKGEKPLIFESQDMKNHGINRKSVELKKVGQKMSDSIEWSDRVGHLSDFVRLFCIESDGQVGHLSVRLVRLGPQPFGLVRPRKAISGFEKKYLKIPLREKILKKS